MHVVTSDFGQIRFRFRFSQVLNGGAFFQQRRIECSVEFGGFVFEKLSFSRNYNIRRRQMHLNSMFTSITHKN